MTRRPEEYDGPATPVGADVDDPSTLGPALEGVDVPATWCTPWTTRTSRPRTATRPAPSARRPPPAGVRQVVYLGGLGADDGTLSAHLRSRREVESMLGEAGVPVTVLRAAIVVGAGGISWEITRQLVKNLPAMVVPRWAKTKTQPIALDDVIRYLVGVVDNEKAIGRVFEIGGTEAMTYTEMLQVASEVMNGDAVPIVSVPVMTPRLSSRWLSLVTDIDTTTGRNLIDSMGVEVVVSDHSIREVVPFEPLSYEEAVRRALEESR